MSTFPGDRLRPYVTAHLPVMGCVLVWRAARKHRTKPKTAERIGILGLVGGFLDLIGGGGWGAMVTTTLIGSGMKLRFAIGTAKLAEFFVTATATSTFVLTIGLSLWPIIAGLIVGGILAAPVCRLCSKVPARPTSHDVGRGRRRSAEPVRIVDPIHLAQTQLGDLIKED